MKRLGFHTLRDKATDTLGDKLSQQLQEDVAPKMSDEEAFSFAEFNAEDAERGGYSDYSYWKSTLRAFFQNKIAVFFLFVMVAVLLFTFIQPYLPGQKDPILIHNDQWGLPLNNIPPSKEFWFGTNSIGQDLWARIWAGTRTSLFIGFSVALVEAVVGILVGVLWGYVRRVEFLFTELYNILDNLPQTLVLVLFSLILKPSIQTMVLAMCMTGWIQMARFVRNQIVILRDRDYNLASRCLGTSTWRILFKNLLPYLVSVIMLRVALAIPAAIGNEVFITYIGLGLPLEIPSLGNLLNEGRLLMTAPPLRYQLIFPTVVLAVITISFYIIGNAFADAADPKNHV